MNHFFKNQRDTGFSCLHVKHILVYNEINGYVMNVIPCLGIPAGSLYCPDQSPHQCGIHTCISVCHQAPRQDCPFHQLQVPFPEPMGSSISKDIYLKAYRTVELTYDNILTIFKSYDFFEMSIIRNYYPNVLKQIVYVLKD